MSICFKNLLLCFLLIALTTRLFSQDTTKLRLERFEALKSSLYKLNIYANKMINLYKNYNLISPEIYKDLKNKVEEFDRSLKARATLDHIYIRRLGNSYDDLTQLIIAVYDSVQQSSKIPKIKSVINKFFNSYFMAEIAIDSYDELNLNNQGFLFRIYKKKQPLLI